MDVKVRLEFPRLSVTTIVTFYSFKGGVGRTMTLVNTAYALAKMGARVLMVDFDLEAPGMSHFFAKEVRERRQPGARDALDLLLDAKASLSQLEHEERPAAPPPSLSAYVVELGPPEQDSAGARLSRYLTGRVDLLPSALEARARDGSDLNGPVPVDYLDRLAALDLPSVFGPHGPGHLYGKHVGDHFRRARFEAPGDEIFALRKRVIASYDFVLVDSRTGLNEISGLCIGPLCDSAVICTGLNEQNIAGTRYFLEKTGFLDRENGKPFLLVVGPVPPWRSAETAGRLETIRHQMGAATLIQIPYHPAAALTEPLFVLDQLSEPIAEAFTRLAGRLMDEATEATSETTSHLLRFRAPDTILGQDGSVGIVPSAFRLIRRPEIAEHLVFMPYPTLLESILLALVSVRHSEPPIIMAVAVALQRHLSASLTRRIVELIGIAGNERGSRDLLVTCVAFFYMRLHGKKGLDLFTKHLNERDCQLLGATLAGDRVGPTTAGLALRSLSGSRTRMPKRWPDEIAYYQFSELYEMRRYPKNWPDLWKVNYSDEELSRTRTIEDLAEGFTQAIESETERSPKFGYRPFESVTNMATPGFSLILSAAAIISEVKGPPAVSTVLKCIEQARMVYGYAWRVMVNWKRLKRVQSCPEFKQFMAAEEAAIQAVEEKFDQGIWPL